MRILLILLFITPLFAKPTLWIIGDSTVRNNTTGQQGWGDPLAKEFDPSKITVVNRAIGGRSSRSFITEGRWDAVLANLKEGDFVLMQFGHNDGGDKFKGTRPRASIKGTGDETETGVVETTGKEETVHSYGWYIRKYCKDTLAKGATPIVVSLIPRNIRDKNGQLIPDTETYAAWAGDSAKKTGAHFIPFNRILTEELNALSKGEVDAIFCGTDHTHTSPKGAAFNARILARELRKLPDCPIGVNLLTKLWLPHLFSNHMVLQQHKAIPVWGGAQVGSKISVTLANQTVTTTASPEGDWKLQLPAFSAGGPHTLTVTSDTTQTFTDVFIGEVWLCSGQSNMDFTVAPTEKRYFAGTANWEEELKSANIPGIRMFTAEWSFNESPQPDVEGAWKIATSENVKDFSAVAWFFARNLHRELNVPVGLITSAFGGSTAEAWMSREKLNSNDSLKPFRETFAEKQLAYRDHPDSLRKYGESSRQWEAAGKKGRNPKHPDPVRDQHNATVLYNGMIAPLIPYGLRGAIWYQGESNVGTRSLYPTLQRSLIEDWRTRWDQAEFPFYFVLLASYKDPKVEPTDSQWASMREAQASSLSLPDTGMAVTIDIGEAKDIHPRNKQDVGARLARLALSGTYQKAIVSSGPTLKSSTIDNGKIILTFENTAKGLVAKNGPLKHFAIASDNKQFRWATASIKGDQITISHPEIQDPKFVRYAWADNPAGANLFNSEDLPAAPFRTDQ